MVEVNRKVVASNLFWRLMERFGAQIVTFVVSIILARLLDPSVYGTIALITVFTSILQVFVASGFGGALIQKKDADDLDFSTVFYFNIFMCIILYGCMFFISPLIARFYGNDELIPVIRVLSLVIVISGVKNIQISYISKKLIFKKFFWATLGGTITAAIIGIWMAYKGYGVWALVVQNLINQTIDTLILWVTVKWRPKKQFSFMRLKTLFSFGWKLLASGLLDTIYNDSRSLIIGKKYSSSDLAFYNRGQTFPNLIVTNINSSISSVLFPSMSNVQSNKARVKQITRRSIMISSYIILPMMVGLAFCAESVVHILLTDKWLPCVFFLRIFCITYAFYPIHTANLSAMKALGRSDYFLTLEIIKKTFGIAAILITMWISIEAMAWSLLFTTAFSIVVNAWPNKKLLNYSLFEQVKDIVPSILLSFFMGFVVYIIGKQGEIGALTLLKQVLVGVVIYFTGSMIFRLEPFEYLMSFKRKA